MASGSRFSVPGYSVAKGHDCVVERWGDRSGSRRGPRLSPDPPLISMSWRCPAFPLLMLSGSDVGRVGAARVSASPRSWLAGVVWVFQLRSGIVVSARSAVSLVSAQGAFVGREPQAWAAAGAEEPARHGVVLALQGGGGCPLSLGAGDAPESPAEVVGHDGEREPSGVSHEVPRGGARPGRCSRARRWSARGLHAAGGPLLKLEHPAGPVGDERVVAPGGEQRKPEIRELGRTRRTMSRTGGACLPVKAM